MVIYFDEQAWTWGLIILALILIFLWQKGRSGSQLFFIALFGFYLLLVVKWTLFPIYIDPARAMGMQGRFMDGVNLIPFHFGPGMNLAYARTGILLNTLLTMPIGFGVSFITRFRPRDLLWLVAAFGVGIEGMQFLISILLGYPYRSIDVNDVIFNSLGVLLGYGSFRLFAWMYTAVTDRLGIRHKGLFLYIHECANPPFRESSSKTSSSSPTN